jgi:hypothetical protein
MNALLQAGPSERDWAIPNTPIDYTLAPRVFLEKRPSRGVQPHQYAGFSP